MKMTWMFVYCVFSFLIGWQAQAQVIAVVGKKKITLQEFKERYSEVKEKTFNPPKPEVFLEDLIRYQVGLQEAVKKDLKKDPNYQRRIEEELYKVLIERAIGKQVENIKITENEMKEYYRKNPEIRTSHILVEFKPDATEAQVAEAKKRADVILKEVLKSKRDFAELVKIYSDDALSKANGGDIGYQTRVTLVPTYYDAALKTDVNSTFRSLVRTRYGFHIIKVTGRRSYQQANKVQIRAALFNEKRVQLFDQYFEKIKKDYSIKINKSLIKNL